MHNAKNVCLVLKWAPSFLRCVFHHFAVRSKKKKKTPALLTIKEGPLREGKCCLCLCNVPRSVSFVDDVFLRCVFERHAALLERNAFGGKPFSLRTQALPTLSTHPTDACSRPTRHGHRQAALLEQLASACALNNREMPEKNHGCEPRTDEKSTNAPSSLRQAAATLMCTTPDDAACSAPSRADSSPARGPKQEW